MKNRIGELLAQAMHALAGQQQSRANARRGGTIIGATVATWAMHGSGPMPS